MTSPQDMPTEQLANLIRAYVTGRGHEWGVIAAAELAAGSDMVLAKLRRFVDEDGWIEWREVAEYVDGSPWSSVEKAMVRLGCSLATEISRLRLALERTLIIAGPVDASGSARRLDEIVGVARAALDGRDT